MKLSTLRIVAFSLASPAAAAPRTETAVLAGGCFWGMEGVFEHVKGVTQVVSGYAGGSAGDANYDKVSSERTGHAEAVKISYDPSASQLCSAAAGLLHGRPRPDRGEPPGARHRHQLSLGDLPPVAGQERFARAFIARLEWSAHLQGADRDEDRAWRFLPGRAFHQGFYRKHPTYPYIVVNDRPKVAALQRKFPALYKS